MRVLLINPPFDYYSKHLLYCEPLSLGYLASYLIKSGHIVNILDAVAGKITKKGNQWHYGMSNAEISQRIKEFKPDMVGITCAFSLRSNIALGVAKLAKKIDKKIITVVGGIHPTIFSKDVISEKQVDYIIIGEGEYSLLELIKQLESGNKLPAENIDGCGYKKGGKIYVNKKTKFIEDLDSLPFPARDLLPMEFYLNKDTILYGVGGGRAATIITSRSCPNKCTFCSMYLSHGPKLRSRSAENVFEELKELVNKYKVEEVFFIDDNLTFNKKHVMKLCKLIMKHNLKFQWNTPNGVRADRLDFELIKTMKKAGCRNICIGVEAGNEDIRNRIIRKGLLDETINKTLQICSKVGLPVVGFFILGIPGETEETFKDTIKMVKKLPFSMITTSFFTPLPGTQLYDECVKKSYITPDYWKKLNRMNIPIVETPDFNQQTLKKWEKEIYFEFFKSHFWQLFKTTITFKNDFIKAALIKRFLTEKFGADI